MGGARPVLPGRHLEGEFRRDDGAGLAVVTSLRDRVPAGVELVLTDGEPTRLIEAWTEASAPSSAT